MRPLSFRKGTLILEFPTDLADRCTDLEFRAAPDNVSWAVRLLAGDRTLLGAGTYRTNAGQIAITGGAVADLPEWWSHGRPERPENWETVRRFGRSDASVRIGRDD